MGLTKQYLRYVPAGIFGVVAAKSCNAVYLDPRRFVVAGGTHVVTLWDTRLYRKVRVLNCDSPSTVVKPNDDYTLLGVGHQNGSLSVFDLKDKSEEASGEPVVTFEGHTSDILCLNWDDSRTIIASGGKDTRVILWDVVSEAGVAKLKGHKGPITQVRFWKESKYLWTSSTDATMKLWDVLTHACVHTIVGTSQIWDFETWGENYIIMAESHMKLIKMTEDPQRPSDWDSEEIGTILRNANDRTRTIQIIEDKYLVTVGAKSQEIEVFILSGPEEATRKMRRRFKKFPETENKLLLRDFVRPVDSVRASEKNIKSIDVYKDKEGILQILCCLPSNQLEVIPTNPNVQVKKTLDWSNKPKCHQFGFDGHRKLVRGIAFSSDKTAILTASADSFRIWNRSTLGCVLSIPHEFSVVCCKFCPGDRHFIAGTTCGHLILGDISIGAISQVEQSGSENVWGLDILPNSMGFVASNGNIVQVYDFSMSDGKLRFDLSRQLDVQESVLCLKVSPNMKFLAVGLLDSTIKVFYLDTFKFHLTMYGHKLPVVSIDISGDNRFLASCSGDKGVRTWGLDFGDCHTTMLHTEGLVGCSFIENTHHIISVAKDSLNYYDGDSHQRIQTVKSHVEGGSTCMAVGGLYIASAGRDQTIRLFNRSQEILVLDDEREREREEELEKEAVAEKNEVTALKTAESEKSTDLLIEALDVFKDNSNLVSPLIQAYGAKDKKEFMFKVLNRIKASELEQSIMLLPVSYVHGMIQALAHVLKHYPLATELCVRCLHSLMKFHLPTLSLTTKAWLQELADLAKSRVKDLKDIVGFNLAGLHFINDKRLEKEQIQEFREMIGERKRRRKRREKALKRAILTV